MELRTFVLLTIPIISGLIGWVTNYVAVKMIFRPKKPTRILFFSLHGLIPRRQAELAKSIAEAIERELISHQDLQEALNRPSTQDKIRNLMKSHFDEIVNRKFRTNPLFSLILNAGEALSIKDLVYDEVLKTLPTFLEHLVKEIETEIDFKQLVEQKILEFDISKLESLVYEIASNELKLIEILGGLLGFLVGVAQVLILLLIQ